jgi:hypothetical protein
MGRLHLSPTLRQWYGTSKHGQGGPGAEHALNPVTVYQSHGRADALRASIENAMLQDQD